MGPQGHCFVLGISFMGWNLKTSLDIKIKIRLLIEIIKIFSIDKFVLTKFLHMYECIVFHCLVCSNVFMS